MSSSTDGPGTEPDRAAARYGDAASGTYLVELRAPAASAGEVHQMHQTLRYAVERQAASGAAIRWTGAVLVPAEGRCLCLVEASAASPVIVAIDSAGLRATPVSAHSVRGNGPLEVSAAPSHHDG